MTAVDDTLAESTLALEMLVEMYLDHIFMQLGREHVLALLDPHAIDMIDVLTNSVIVQKN